MHCCRYKLLLAGIIDDPKERGLMTVDDDYEEPLLTVVEVGVAKLVMTAYCSTIVAIRPVNASNHTSSLATIFQ